MKKDIFETQGEAALQRLFAASSRDAGQSRYVARFLLSLYNGERFPLDLKDLRAIDDALFEDCIAVLRMDARVARQELHLYIKDGGPGFEKLANFWGIEDIERVRLDARRAMLPEGAPAPLHDGGTFPATLLSYGNAPGYRDLSVRARFGEQGNTYAELRISPADSEALMLQIAYVHMLAWRSSERGPLDVKEGEKRPRWLDKTPLQWSST
ncbi:hypothetical protein [Variovorax paradoxus]|uniref:DUF7673 family protein n=1 Tax=Variovorax paradoxus TaxID=34073 RepID=UPI001931AB60|nr:hypothetical protein INQ48_43310 [Variovorax paradoxus]